MANMSITCERRLVDLAVKMGVTKEECERRLVVAFERAAQAWCMEETKSTVADPILAEAFAVILVKEMYAAHLECAKTSEMLAEIQARSREEATTGSGRRDCLNERNER